MMKRSAVIALSMLALSAVVPVRAANKPCEQHTAPVCWPGECPRGQVCKSPDGKNCKCAKATAQELKDVEEKRKNQPDKE